MRTALSLLALFASTLQILLAQQPTNGPDGHPLISNPDKPIQIEGVYISAFCGGEFECVPTFRVSVQGKSLDKQFSYTGLDIPLFIGDPGMPEAEANPDLLGKRFIIAVKRGVEYGEEGDEFFVDEIVGIKRKD